MVMDDKGAQRPCWKVSELLVKARPERRKLGYESFRQEAPRWGREQCTLVLFFPKDKRECRDSLALPPMPGLGIGEVGL